MEKFINELIKWSSEWPIYARRVIRAGKLEYNLTHPQQQPIEQTETITVPRRDYLKVRRVYSGKIRSGRKPRKNSRSHN